MQNQESNVVSPSPSPKVSTGEDSVHEPVRNIFEIVDVSDEEAYFTIGVFLSLEEAVAAVEAKAEPWQLCESAMFDGESASMEIRRKPVNVLDPLNNGDVVWSRKWVNKYDDDADESAWIIIPNAQDHGSLPGASVDNRKDSE